MRVPVEWGRCSWLNMDSSIQISEPRLAQGPRSGTGTPHQDEDKNEAAGGEGYLQFFADRFAALTRARTASCSCSSCEKPGKSACRNT